MNTQAGKNLLFGDITKKLTTICLMEFGGADGSSEDEDDIDMSVEFICEYLATFIKEHAQAYKNIGKQTKLLTDKEFL